MLPEPGGKKKELDGLITLTEAAKGSPYSQEYLSLLARRGKLFSKKIGRNWYTTGEAIQNYLTKQGLTVIIPKSEINSSYRGKISKPVVMQPQGPQIVGAGVVFHTSEEEEIKRGEQHEVKSKLLEEFEKLNISPTSPVEKARVPEELQVISLPVVGPHPKPIRPGETEEIPSEALGKVPSEASAIPISPEIKETLGKISESLETLSQLQKTQIEKQIVPTAVQPPVPAYEIPPEQKEFFEIESKSFSHRLRRLNYLSNQTLRNPKKLLGIVVAAVVLLFLIGGGFSFGQIDVVAQRVGQFFKNADTLQGHFAGTHANEVLLLDKAGNVSIFGHIKTQGQLRSFAPDGIAPITVDSTTLVENLNAEYLDGLASKDFTLAFVTKNGNITYEDVYLEGNVEVGKTLSVKGAAKLLDSLSVYGKLGVFSDAVFGKDVKLTSGNLKIEKGSAEISTGSLNIAIGNLQLGQGTIEINNRAMIKNLNSEFLQGLQPGDFTLDYIVGNGNETDKVAFFNGGLYGGDGAFKSLGVAGDVSIGSQDGAYKHTVTIFSKKFSVDSSGNLTASGKISGGSLSVGPVVSDLIPSGSFDLGSSANRWTEIYGSNADFTSIIIGSLVVSGSANFAGTSSQSFVINTDNVSSDSEDAYLAFERGTITPNAKLSWNSTGKRFEFNEPVYIASTSMTAFSVSGGAASLSNVLWVSPGGYAGNVGIGTSEPLQKLQVNDTATAAFVVTSAGQVGIGTTSPLTKLEVQGTASASNLLTVGSLQVANGGATVSYSRFGIGDTGHGLNAANDLLINGKLEVNGTSYFDGTANFTGIASAAYFYAQDGSASAPSYTFSLDTGTGLFRKDADSISISAGGLERLNLTDTTASISNSLYIDSTGNVGIGETSPLTKLEVSGGAASISNTLYVQNGGNVGVGTTVPTQRFQVNDTATAAFVVTSAGQVGIGTTSPTTKLEVKGTASASYGQFSQTIQVGAGGIASVSYNRFGIGITSHAGSIAANNDLLISGDLEVNGSAAFDGNITAGTTNTNILIVTSQIQSNLIPLTNAYNLGSTGNRWGSIFVDTAYVSMLTAASTSISGTAANHFLINSDNDSNDAQDMSVTFKRGLPTTNAVLQWEKDYKRFNFNFPVFIQTVDLPPAEQLYDFTKLTLKSAVHQGSNDYFEIQNSSDQRLFVVETGGGFAASGSFQAGGLSVATASYSRFGIGSTTHTNWISTADDLFLSNDLEGRGSISFAGPASISNTLWVSPGGYSGNVGIGTTGPDYSLQVNGTIAPEITDQDLGTTSLRWNLLANTINADNAVTLTGLGAGTDNTVLILDSSNNVTTDEIDSRVWGSSLVDYSGTSANYIPKMVDTDTITNSVIYESSGNIGIGDTGPNEKLDVTGNILASTSGDVDLVIKSTTRTADEGLFRIRSSSASDRLDILNQSSALVSIASTGYVGIGETSPLALLHITKDQDAITELRIDNTNATSNAGMALTLYDGSNRRGFLEYSTSAAILTLSTDSSSGQLKLGSGLAATAVTIDSTGNVGIGTTAPTTKLEIVGTASASYGIFTNALNAGLGNVATVAYNRFGTAITTHGNYISDSSDLLVSGDLEGRGSISFAGPASLSNTMWIQQNGNVGIGETTPTAKLEIAGSIGLTASISNTFFVDAANQRVGIGTMGPGALLDITTGVFFPSGIGLRVSFYGPNLADFLTTGDIPGKVRISGGGTSNGNSGLEVYRYNPTLVADTIYGEFKAGFGVGSSWPTTAGVHIASRRAGAAAFTPLMFHTSDIERMRIDTDGNVGIGTTVPASTLHLRGENAAIIVDYPATGNPSNPRVQIRRQDAAASREAILRLSDLSNAFDIDMYLPAGESDALRFRRNTSDWVTFKNGNVGIGNTGPNEKLDVTGNILASASGDVDLILRSTSVTNADRQFTLRSGLVGAVERLGIFNGANTELVTIASTGYVGIGTTSPGYKLDVNGIVNATALYVGASALTLTSVIDGSVTGTWTKTNDAIAAWNGGVLTATFANALTPGSIIFVGATAAYSLIGPPPTDTAGNTYYFLGNIPTGGNQSLWYALNASSTNSNVISKTGFNWALIHAIEFTHSSGLPLAIERVATNTGDTGTGGGQNVIGGTLITSVDNSLIVGWGWDAERDITAAGTGFTAAIAETYGSTHPYMMEYLTQATAGTIAATWHSPTNSVAYGGFTVAVSAGARNAVSSVDSNQRPLIDFSQPGHIGTTVNFGAVGGLTAQGNLTLTAAVGNIILMPNGGYNIAGGNVGIGETTPTAKLEIAGSIGLTASISNTFFVDAANQRVGIGTTGPGSKLHVYNTINDGGLTITNSLTTTGSTARTMYSFGTSFAPTAMIEARKAATGSNLVLMTHDGSWHDSLYVQNTGNVGIGETTPTAKLEIAGSIGLTASISNTFFVDAANQRVGIGTTGPGQKLEISGDNNQLKLSTTGTWSSLYTYTGASGTGALIFSSADAWLESRTGNLRFGAGGVMAERMTILAGGNVGIGTATPSKLLDVQGAVEVNLPGTGTSWALCHTTQTGVTNEEIVDCTGAPVQDYQEFYPARPDIEVGDIVVPSSDLFAVTASRSGSLADTKTPYMEKSNSRYQANILGVASNPIDSGDFNTIGFNSLKQSDNPFPLALSGRVAVKVNLENGPMKVGDLITTSSMPGVGMKATGAGRVVGMALENFDGTNCGTSQVGTTCDVQKILVFVNPHWYGGDLTGGGSVGMGVTASSSSALDDLLQAIGLGDVVEISHTSGFESLSLKAVKSLIIDAPLTMVKDIWAKGDAIVEGIRKTYYAVANLFPNVDIGLMFANWTSRDIEISQSADMETRLALSGSGAQAADQSRLGLEENGNYLATYGVDSTRGEIQLSGSSDLVAGEAKVYFDYSFTAVISDKIPLKILLTPTTNSIRGQMYTAQKSAYGFVVRELNGTSTGKFDWLVIARRKGYDADASPTASPSPTTTPLPSAEPAPPAGEPVPISTPSIEPSTTPLPSETPTLTPEPSPSATPSTTPEVTPSPAPESTPTPTPTPLETPAPIPELTPTPTPEPSPAP